MPIDGLSGNFRPPRMAKIRLGYKPVGKNYPKDSDVFVAHVEDGVTKAMLDAYSKGKIDGAEGEAWSFGKSLRMLSYFEWDQTHPATGQELVVGLLNRAWTHSKLHCSGTGGDRPGEAFCRDEGYKDAITKATKTQARGRDGGWTIECRGPKCPMWHSNNKQNPLASCHRELRFLAQLLDPTTDPESPHYLKNLGSVEIVSGSFNGAIDVQSGLQLLRSVAGRSFNVPFDLVRRPQTMLVDGKRLVKATLAVTFDNDEAIRFGYSDPKLSIVRPAVRKQLMAQRREQLELARLEVTFDSARDIVPQLPASAEPEPVNPDAIHASDTHEDLTADRDDVVDAAVQNAEPQLSAAELKRALTQGERDELKTLSGGKPGDSSSLDKLRGLMKAAAVEFGDELPDFASLRVKHALWIRKQLDAERAE